MCAAHARRIAVRTRDNQDWFLAHCAQCGFYYTDPPPALADIRGFYGGDYHSELRQPGASEKIFGAKFKNYVDWLAQKLTPGRSLDVGCATGLFVKLLQEAGFEAEGYEANALSAAWGREYFEVPIFDGIFDPASSKPSHYDLISLCDVLEHTLDPMQYLASLRPLLRPSGHVFITFPDIESWESRYFRSLSIVLRRSWLWRSCNVPYHTWEFTPDTARTVFRKAGFRLVAFRRCQDSLLSEDAGSGRGSLVRFLVDLPPRLLSLPVLNGAFGTQMHFLLRAE